MLPLVQIKNFSVSFGKEKEKITAVNNISFDVPPGRVTALIGESGSGKSVTALSFMQLLSPKANITGEMLFSESIRSTVNLLTLSPHEIRKIRGNKISMIFQEPMTSLNPVQTCGAQVAESLVLHKKLSKRDAAVSTVELFKKVELPSPEKIFKRYPHEISGGQKQRVMIAMAMSCGPSLLIADEPTTALDVRVQMNILDLLKNLQAETGMAILLITHDLALVADVADDIVVMYKGEIVEKGNTQTLLNHPKHNYTKALLACRPSVKSKGRILPIVSDFLNEGGIAKDIATINITKREEEIALRVEGLKVFYPDSKNIFGKTLSEFKAVDDVSFLIRKNETVGLVGESGCGKTTLGRAVLGLIQPTAGKIYFDGKDLSNCSPAEMRIIRKDLQIVFQDPYGSLNPRLSIGNAIMEPIKVHFPGIRKAERREQAGHLLEQVQIKPDMMGRYPHEFSGGQRQRICIARALALNPDLLIFDESVSALDVSVQAQVLNLINELKSRYSFSSLFISHDLSVIHYISDRVMVMHKGKIIEEGSADAVFNNPQATYTKDLLAAVPGRNFVI